MDSRQRHKGKKGKKTHTQTDRASGKGKFRFMINLLAEWFLITNKS